MVWVEFLARNPCWIICRAGGFIQAGGLISAKGLINTGGLKRQAVDGRISARSTLLGLKGRGGGRAGAEDLKTSCARGRPRAFYGHRYDECFPPKQKALCIVRSCGVCRMHRISSELCFRVRPCHLRTAAAVRCRWCFPGKATACPSTHVSQIKRAPAYAHGTVVLRPSACGKPSVQIPVCPNLA